MKILVFAPHNDDEVLGVGGTIAKYARHGDEVYVCEVTSGDNTEKVDEIRNEALRAHRILGVKDTVFLGLPVVALKNLPSAVLNAKIRDVVDEIKPVIAFIPHQGDIHTDHIEVAASAMVALRPVGNAQLKAIYAYETLSETEWSRPVACSAFVPNLWSDITDTIEQKLDALRCYQTQIRPFPSPRSCEAAEALAKLRGSTILTGYAESFMVMRQIL